jgi:hypothetical protein
VNPSGQILPFPINGDYDGDMSRKISKEAAKEFLGILEIEVAKFNEMLSTDNGDWIVKGFIDIYKNVYTISNDTKVVSKLIELMLFPYFVDFAARHNLKLVPSREQNHYPDITFVHKEGYKFAVDLKSTYRLANPARVSTMTLGAFTGYFRDRSSSKNITFPYEEYSGHFILGVIYSRPELRADELKVRAVDELREIPSVVKDLEFFVQPKYRVARDKPGSGNTKNIGAVNDTSSLINGEGPFASRGEEVFDDYWMYYLTKDMARAVELKKAPYNSLAEYLEYKKNLS